MNLTFFSSLPSFINPIAEYFSTKEQTRVFVHADQNTLLGVLQTTEVGWFDFANELLITSQNIYKYNTFRTIVRLHSYEAFTPFPRQVDWNRVDDLVLVNKSVGNILAMQDMWNDISARTRIHVIPNLVQTDKYALTHDKAKKIAFLGHINYKKDPSWIIPIAEALPDFEICIGGEHQDLRYKIAFDQFTPKNIKFEGYQKDVNTWLKDKMFILNTSLFESFNYAIAEGMLCGAIPIVRNWYGVHNVYPKVPAWNSLKECVGIIKDYVSMGDELTQIRESNSKFIKETYDFNVVIPQIEKLIYAPSDNS